MRHYKSKILNFDTAYGKYVLDINNPASQLSPYITNFTLQSPIRHIHRIYLETIEIPINFPNVRGPISFNYTTSGGSSGVVTITINGIYTTISSLMSYFATQMNLVLPSGCTVSLAIPSTSYDLVQITTTGLSNFTLANGSNTQQFIKNILGFNGTEVFANNKLTASNAYNLNLDNFITMYLNIPCETTAMNLTPQSFKIPLPAVSQQIFYFTSGQGYKPFINITDPNFVLSNMTVSLYDRFNNSINPYGSDYTFTLRVEYE